MNGCVRKSVFGLFLVILVLVFSQVTSAYAVGPNQVVDISGKSYFVRIDYDYVNTPCAGVLPPPHLNVVVYNKLGPNSWSSPIANWHIAWVVKNNQYCLVAYNSVSRTCSKNYCYDNKDGKGGDILPSLGIPTQILNDAGVANVFKQFYITPGASPWSVSINWGGIVIILLAATLAILYALLKCFLTFGTICS